MLARKTWLRRSQQPIRPIRKRYTTAAWRALGRQVYLEQGGLCASCGRWFRCLDLAHLKQLGRGRSRHDEDNPLNQRPNVVGMNRACHAAFDRLRPEDRLVEAERLRKK